MNPASYRCKLPKLLLNIYEKYYINCIIYNSPVLSRGPGERVSGCLCFPIGKHDHFSKLQ